MNKKYIEEIMNLRGNNRPVRYIAKKLGVNKEVIEEIITSNIISSEPLIDGLVKGKQFQESPDYITTKQLIEKLDINVVFKNNTVLSYIAKNRSNHHDRLMDYIRYLLLSLKKDQKS